MIIYACDVEGCENKAMKKNEVVNINVSKYGRGGFSKLFHVCQEHAFEIFYDFPWEDAAVKVESKVPHGESYDDDDDDDDFDISVDDLDLLG